MKKHILTDFHSCLSLIPWFFRALDKSKVRLDVVTGSPDTFIPEIRSFLRKNNIKVDKIYNPPSSELSKEMAHLVNMRIYPTGFSAYKRTWKIQKVIELNPDLFYDNEELVTREIYRNSEEGRIKTIPVLLYVSEKYGIRKDLVLPTLLLNKEEHNILKDRLNNGKSYKTEKKRQLINKILK